MSGSLKNIQILNEPKHTGWVIRSAVRSRIGRDWMWVVVEDEDDVAVYARFMEANTTRILPSLAEDLSKGCKNVETIVEDIRTNVTSRIAGIRDADYVRYEQPEYVLPEHVYLTEERDIEMQMLASESVQNGLADWNADITAHLDWIYTNVAHERGCMRLLNDVYHLGCSFKKDAPIARLWDGSKRTKKDGWQDALYDEFIMDCKNTSSAMYPFTRAKYHAIKEEKGLAMQSLYRICQGHDVLTMLQYKLGKNQYNAQRIMAKMTELYSLEDFQRTKLYFDLLTLQDKLNVKYLK